MLCACHGTQLLTTPTPAGWAGYNLAREIDKSKYQVVVVSPRSYFVFTPLLASTSVGTLEFRTCLEPIRTKRTNVDFFQGWADQVDYGKKTLMVEEAVENPYQGYSLTGKSKADSAEEQEKATSVQKKKGKMFEMSWDKLVIAVGCYSQTFNTPGVKEHAYFLKDVGDARKIRNRMLSCEWMSGERLEIGPGEGLVTNIACRLRDCSTTHHIGKHEETAPTFCCSRRWTHRNRMVC